MKNEKFLIILITILLGLVVPFCIINAETIPTADVTVTSWTDLQNEINSAETAKVIKIGSDIVDPNPETASDIKIPAGKEITIDLNGHVIDRGIISGGLSPETGDRGSAIQVYGTLTIVDGNPNLEHKGTISTDGYFWTWDGGTNTGDTIIKGGIITGGSRTGNYNGGSAIRIYTATSTLTMKGGTIAGNKSIKNGHGGGVYVEKGTFNMSGGTIEYNTAVLHGGGVFIHAGHFVMSGSAKITKNAVSSNGGGVYLMAEGNGTFTMKGGEISYNKGNDGGGVRVESSMTIEGGIIKNNIATGDGGGVRGTVIMSGGEITNNTASASGGGVRGSSTITGGKITNNTAGAAGGGYYGNLTMTGGEITGNTSTGNGGGLFVETVTLGGSAKISGNFKGTVENNAYLTSGRTFAISTEKAPTSDMSVGITTAVAPVVGTPVAITSNGSETDIEFFTSDNPDYSVLFNTNHLELHAHNFEGDYIEYDTVNHKWAKKCTCGEYDTKNALTGIEVPTAKTNLMYNGKKQTGVEEGTGYTLVDNEATEVGDNYKAIATLEEGYIWSDGTFEPKEIEWSISKYVKPENPKTGDTRNVNLMITLLALCSLWSYFYITIYKKSI